MIVPRQKKSTFMTIWVDYAAFKCRFVSFADKRNFGYASLGWTT